MVTVFLHNLKKAWKQTFQKLQITNLENFKNSSNYILDRNAFFSTKKLDNFLKTFMISIEKKRRKQATLP